MATLHEHLLKQKDQILILAQQYHAMNIRLFGSTVRGEERMDSDIDFLVDFLPGATLVDQAGLITALSSMLGRNVDVVSERSLNRHIKDRILREAVEL